MYKTKVASSTKGQTDKQCSDRNITVPRHDRNVMSSSIETMDGSEGCLGHTSSLDEFLFKLSFGRGQDVSQKYGVGVPCQGRCLNPNLRTWDDNVVLNWVKFNLCTLIEFIPQRLEFVAKCNVFNTTSWRRLNREPCCQDVTSSRVQKRSLFYQDDHLIFHSLVSRNNYSLGNNDKSWLITTKSFQNYNKRDLRTDSGVYHVSITMQKVKQWLIQHFSANLSFVNIFGENCMKLIVLDGEAEDELSNQRLLKKN